MKYINFIIFLILTILIIPLHCSKNIFAQNFISSFTLENTYLESFDDSIKSSYQILFTSENSINLSKGNTVNLNLYLKDNESNTKYSLIICCLKVEDNLNKNSIIKLIKSLNNLSDFNTSDNYNNILLSKTLEIKTLLTTSFEVNSDGKYIFFVLDEHNAIDASKFDVDCEYTIDVESEFSVNLSEI